MKVKKERPEFTALEILDVINRNYTVPSSRAMLRTLLDCIRLRVLNPRGYYVAPITRYLKETSAKECRYQDRVFRKKLKLLIKWINSETV